MPDRTRVDMEKAGDIAIVTMNGKYKAKFLGIGYGGAYEFRIADRDYRYTQVRPGSPGHIVLTLESCNSIHKFISHFPVHGPFIVTKGSQMPFYGINRQSPAFKWAELFFEVVRRAYERQEPPGFDESPF